MEENRNNWSDFEKYLIKRIDGLEKEMTAQKVIAARSGGFWGFITALATVIGTVIVKGKGG